MSRMATNLPNPNDVSPTTSHDLRCPQCGAHISSPADWCTLCFADLRVPPAAEIVLDDVAAEQTPDPDPSAEASAEQPTEQIKRGGKHARRATADSLESVHDGPLSTERRPLDEAESAELEARASEMLAMLAADTSHPLGPLAARLESNGSRAVAATVGALVLLLAGLLVMSLVGRFI
jgi:hypothetical protein